MTDQEDHVEEQKEEVKKSEIQYQGQVDQAIQKQISLLKLYVQEQKHLLKLYLRVSIGSFIAFVIFVLLLVGSNWISKISPDIGIIVRIVAWSVTVLSAICCFFAVLCSVIGFFQFLIRSLRFWIKGPKEVKTPPQKTPEQEAADEEEDQ